jgi:hypothetical protein
MGTHKAFKPFKIWFESNKAVEAIILEVEVEVVGRCQSQKKSISTQPWPSDQRAEHELLAH